VDSAAPGFVSENEFRKQGGPLWTSWLKERAFLTTLPLTRVLEAL